MGLNTASFVIALIGLLISVSSFMMEKENPGIRRPVGFIAMFFALIFGVLGIISSISSTVSSPQQPDTSVNNTINRTYTIYANQTWQPTGIQIQPGDSLQITASGQWTGRSSAPGYSGPDYGPEPNNSNTCFPIPGEGSSLVAKIENGQAFKIGAQYFGKQESSGELNLRMNDCDNSLFDDDGSMSVTVTVKK